MKKIYFLLLVSILILSACDQIKPAVNNDVQPANTNQNIAQAPATNSTIIKWQTYTDKDRGFTFQYPEGWNANGGGDIECASIYEIEDIRLIVFGACWKDYVDGPKLTLAQTYDRFKKGYPPVTPIVSQTINGLKMEIIKYSNSGDNGIFNLSENSQGTIALWQNKNFGYALIDENNLHQSDNTFQTIMNSFQFSNK
jgi:hypothetical protein